MTVLRTYRPEDCPALTRLFHDTVHTVNAADYDEKQLDAWSDGSPDLQAWNASLSSHYTIVAETDGELSGFGDIDNTGYLDRLYVSSRHQRQGVGAAICDMLESTVSSGIITVHSSITARGFFEKRGYTVTKRQEVIRKGVVLVNFVMKKEI